MSWDKYKFDPEKLNYQKVNKSLKYKVLKALVRIGAAFFAGLIIIVVYSFFFDTPKERRLRQENKSLSQDFRRMNESYQRIDTVLRELSYIDKNIYRTIFETDPLNLTDSARSGRVEMLKLLTRDNETIVSVSAAGIDKIMEGVKRNSVSYLRLHQHALAQEGNLRNIPAIQPIENHDLTRLASGFGNRMHPYYKILKFHSGIDFTAPTGTEVYATADGRVEDITRTGRGHGNTIVINHGNAYKTSYSHLDGFNVRKGRKVERGELIGWVGNSGFSTAPHLHYEVELNGDPVNPVNFFFLELSPKEYNRIVEMSIKSGQSFD